MAQHAQVQQIIQGGRAGNLEALRRMMDRVMQVERRRQVRQAWVFGWWCFPCNLPALQEFMTQHVAAGVHVPRFTRQTLTK